jgi:threonine dehydrogenase-like Zn-dependent dehydrogenase
MSSITARVATLPAPKQLVFEAEQLDDASLGVSEVLCETLVSVISPGTELAAYCGAPPLRPGVVYPRLVGYCNVARVLARGSSVSSVAVGDRILTLQSHRSHFKTTATDIVALVPSALTSRDAACGYLYQLGYNAVLRADVRLGSSVAVIGMGALGLTTVAMAALAGAKVFALSDYPAASERARTFGAAACFSRSQASDLYSALRGVGADVVVSTTGSWADWRIALNAAGEQGTIAVLGFPGRESPEVPFNPLESATFYVKQLRIVATGHSPHHPEPKGFLPFNLRDNMRRIFEWMTQGSLKPAGLVSGEFRGLELRDAYESLLRRDGAPVTFALTWGV